MGAGVSPQGGGLLHCCLPLSMSNGVRRKTLGITPLTTARAGVGRWPRLPGRPLLQAPKAPVDACHKMPLSVCLRLLDYNRRSFDWGKGALERPVLRPSLLPFLLKKRSKDRGERKLGKIQKKKKKKSQKPQRSFCGGAGSSVKSSGNGGENQICQRAVETMVRCLGWSCCTWMFIFFPFHSGVSGCIWAAWHRSGVGRNRRGKRKAYILSVWAEGFMILFKFYTSLKCFSISPKSACFLKVNEEGKC